MFNPFSIGVIIISYFIGNISPAILIGKMAGIDIRKQGSGNPGSTNVLRVLGKKAAFATLAIDILKGILAVLLGRYIGGQELAIACGMAAFIGHIWPAMYRFKGGKGIATTVGVILTIEPYLGLVMASIAILVIALTRQVSVGSIVGGILLPVAAYFFEPSYLIWSIPMAIIILIKHRNNINRLLKGQEPKISFKK